MSVTFHSSRLHAASRPPECAEYLRSVMESGLHPPPNGSTTIRNWRSPDTSQWDTWIWHAREVKAVLDKSVLVLGFVPRGLCCKCNRLIGIAAESAVQIAKAHDARIWRLRAHALPNNIGEWRRRTISPSRESPDWTQLAIMQSRAAELQRRLSQERFNWFQTQKIWNDNQHDIVRIVEAIADHHSANLTYLLSELNVSIEESNVEANVIDSSKTTVGNRFNRLIYPLSFAHHYKTLSSAYGRIHSIFIRFDHQLTTLEHRPTALHI